MMETQMSYGEDYKYLPMTSVNSGSGEEVLPDLYSLTVQIVNVCFIGNPDKGDWVLVDAGMPYSAEAIIAAAESRFGVNSRPKGIVLTHGHFDHVGAIVELVEHWDVPVFAHEMELPYLTGKSSYPPTDPTVEGGLVAKLSFVFPIQPIDLGRRVQALPAGGSIPILPEWRWLHTPGHSPGHVSLFREEDRSLIAGDAFVTVEQESLYKVFTQKLEISGPPRYFTPDWIAAEQSVKKLALLTPSIAITGHGHSVKGQVLVDGLRKLVDEFEQEAVPDYGKYVH